MRSRNALVTGGSRGIGRAVVEQLTKNGHRVYAMSRTPPEDLPKGADFVSCDLTVADSLVECLRGLDPIDILVNNAGDVISQPIEKIELSEWERHFAINSTAPFICIRELISGMRERSWGRIVTVASTAALEGTPYVASYTASKHSLIGLMRVLALELGESGVTANTVCPTYVRTEMISEALRNIVRLTGATTEEAEARLRSQTPGGRIIEVEEVSKVVVDLIDGGENGLEVLLDGRNS